MRICTPLLLVTLLLPSDGFAQFGKLKGLFDKAKSLSEMEITEEEEIALGEAISQKIREVYGVDQDLEATRYVTMTGLVLTQQSSRPDLPYRFTILDSETINAFAAPGGFIHITRGALASLKDESQLSGVLGHEIAHVTEKHTVKGIQKLKGIEVADGQTSLTGDQAVFEKIVEKGTEAVLQGFGRKEELEADKVGVQIASHTGYHPDGLIEFLGVLSSRNEGSESRSGLFASHPETEERIKKLARQVEKEKLNRAGLVTLADRYDRNIDFEVKEPSEDEPGVEGARGLTGSDSDSEGNEKSEEQSPKAEAGEKKEEVPKEEEKKPSRFSLARLKNPFGGKKKETAEVTGSGAGRGVGKEKEVKGGKPKNAALVLVKITPEELQEFKDAGRLITGP